MNSEPSTGIGIGVGSALMWPTYETAVRFVVDEAGGCFEAGVLPD